MEHEISKGKYLEHGEFDGNIYGTKYDAVRHVIHSGQMCILDVSAMVSQRAV
jgi:guanylate kinase